MTWIFKSIIGTNMEKTQSGMAAGFETLNQKASFLLSISYSTWALNHRDRNITAAYLCVSPRHWALSPCLHLHFVDLAKHCHPKSLSNLPPYGSSAQKATAVAWRSHTAPSASVWHVVEERDGLSPNLTLFFLHYILLKILHPVSHRSIPLQSTTNPSPPAPPLE